MTQSTHLTSVHAVQILHVLCSYIPYGPARVPLYHIMTTRQTTFTSFSTSSPRLPKVTWVYNLPLHFIMMNVVLDLTSEMNSFILRLVLSHVAFDISAFSIFAFANYDLAH
ncbi:uncharacterized protein HD556DRAFT_140926 [Suillus plorans]|uniref:Uncharacterized protein n=1 Tax=Suillus plorans TaxID=116603 RepID=A0A9P7ABX8_9AGAM|nr:uncharacterized protein HD556DRAFT_140926 [Suillus plorans]KAG1785315.1 hypothetical protein HD556DRAFT_140926 [Suillus plorans]